jgi:uncharacterized protein YjbJ (UPF0337 family)
MNRDLIEGTWRRMKGRTRQQWGKLTDNQLAVVLGRREALIGRLQQQCGVAKVDEQAKFGAKRSLTDFQHYRL